MPNLAFFTAHAGNPLDCYVSCRGIELVKFSLCQLRSVALCVTKNGVVLCFSLAAWQGACVLLAPQSEAVVLFVVVESSQETLHSRYIAVI